MRGLIRRLAARPLRSFLTLLQIVLSTLAVTAALTAYRTTTAQMLPPERFDLVAATEGEHTTLEYGLFESRDLEELAALAPAVEAIALGMSIDMPTVEVGENVYQLRTAAAVSEGFLDLGDVVIRQGTWFTREESEAGAQVAVVSTAAASVLFPGGAVGSEFRLRPQRTVYHVVGVFERVVDPVGPALYIPLGANPFGLSALSARTGAGRSMEGRRELLLAARKVYSNKLAELGRAPGNDFQWSVPDGSEDERGFRQTNLVIFVAFAIATMAVGSIGAFSLLTVSALDRLREVGLRRAMGETRVRVVSSVATEAGAFGLVGGLLGAALAAFVVPLLRPAAGTGGVGMGALAFDPTVAAMAVVLSVGLNVLLSLPPALHVTSDRPARALAGTFS